MIVRQSTAGSITVGPVLDADGVAVTDGVIGDFKISKNGAAPAALNGSATLTHRHTGHYSLTWTTSDVDTVGTVDIVIDDTVNACAPVRLQVIEEAIYDAFYAASATPDHFKATSVTVSDKTGFSLASSQTFDLTGNITGNLSGSVGSVSGNVSGSVGSISGVTFPTNFGDLTISATTGYVDLGFIKGVDAITQLGSTCATASSVSLNAFDWTGITVGAISDKSGFSLAADQSGVTIGTVNAMAGTITTLDALDAAQDSQHSTTQAAIGALNNIAATDIVSAGPITTLSGAVVNVDTVDTCTTNTDMRGTDNALLAASTPANFAALGINVSGHVSRVTLVDTTTTNTDMRGTDGANTTTPPSVSAIRTEIDSNSTQLAAILQDTGTTLPAQITLAQNDLDILTGTDGATISTASTTAIGTGFLSTALTKGTAGTIERAFWQILKTQAVTDGTAVADASNTTTTFYTDLTAADNVYDHMIILFTSNGLEGEARPIDTYVQTNGVITLQEALTTAPTGDEEFIILPQHAHPISEIQDGLATSANQTTILNRLGAFTGTGVNTVLGFFKAMFRNDASLPSDIGGTYAASTMSLEANKTEHDATQTAVSAVSTSGDWTDDEKDEIRYRLGIDGDTSAPLTNSPNLEIGGAAGSGSDLVTLTLKDGLGNVVSDAEVWISTDLAGTSVTAGTLRTNDLGKVTFMLDHGTSYYRWADKSGVNFTNPTQFTAVRD